MAFKKQKWATTLVIAVLAYFLRRVMKKKYPIYGKTVLVTGGATGLGKSIAKCFAERGASRIILWDINEDNLNSATKELTDRYRATVTAMKLDVSNKVGVQKAKEALQWPVDILILNAGIVSGNSPLVDIAETALRRTLEVNVMQLFFVTQAFLSDMIQRKEGHIVTISSVSGIIGVNRLADYGTSKWAALGFAENLRVELKATKSQVRSTVILPMFINTGMFDGVDPPWLLPFLTPENVSERIADAVANGDETVGLPYWVPSVVSIGRLLPTWMLDRISAMLGVNRSMESFRGRQP